MCGVESPPRRAGSDAMAHDETNSTDRRTFLQAGALATAAALSLAPARRKAQEAAAKAADRPHAAAGQDRRRNHDARPGGRSGAGPRPAPPARLSPAASASSTPPRSTAPSPTSRSGSSRRPRSASRSSSSPRTCPGRPAQMLDDARPAAGGPRDRLHRPLLHPRPGRRPHASTRRSNFVKSQEFKETAEAIRKSGKAKFIGFSTHHKDRAQIIQAAAEGGSSTRSCSSTPPGSTRTRR